MFQSQLTDPGTLQRRDLKPSIFRPISTELTIFLAMFDQGKTTRPSLTQAKLFDLVRPWTFVVKEEYQTKKNNRLFSTD